jgi:hypothetical protein
VTWVLSLAPHFGQRRAFNCMTKSVRGRFPIAGPFDRNAVNS